LHDPNLIQPFLPSDATQRAVMPLPQYVVRSGATGTPLKLGWNRGGVTQEHKKPAILETVQDMTKFTMTD